LELDPGLPRDYLMNHEAETGSAQAPDGGGHRPVSSGECPPFQTRAPFLQNWNWQSVASINERACARGGAQHGINPEAGEAVASEWEARHGQTLTLGETFDFLRQLHRKAPFLFLNGNTFSYIGRELCIALFSDLPALRKRELSSAVREF